MNELQVYQEVERAFFGKISKELGENLHLYCLTGGMARNDLIPGWSDIDVLLVVSGYSKDVFKMLNDALLENTVNIKIGLTIYTDEEFGGVNFLDPKTLVAIKLISEGAYTPRVLGEDFMLPKVNDYMIKQANLVDFPRNLHELKRRLLAYTGRFEEEQKIYKLIIIQLKILLSQHGIIAIGYDKVINKAETVFEGIPALGYPQNILTQPSEKNKRYENYISFLNWLKSYVHVPLEQSS